VSSLPPVAILCGGLGTRLRSLGTKVPKALMELNGEPFIAHQLRLLQSRGLVRAVLCVGYLGEMIRNYVGEGTQFGMRTEFSFDGPALLGTAGAVRRALPLLSESVFVLYGDSYLPCDYRAVYQAFCESGRTALMTVFHNQGQYDHSNVEFDGAQIQRYDKIAKAESLSYIDYGLGVFHESVFEQLPEAQPWDLARVYQDQLAAGQLAALEVKERFYEIGSPEGLRDTAAYLRHSAAARRSLPGK
jgi:NDP-sugar pyrophosphorylase family protein